MTLAATTKLEAVNTMLSVIGEAPVSSLDTNATGDVAIAKNILDEVLKEVPTRGESRKTAKPVRRERRADKKITEPQQISR